VRVSLLYNGNAGDGVPLDHIRDAIEQRGHELVQIVEKHTDLGQLLDGLPDIVAVAGGDGTVALAVRTLAHRGIPLAILPLGTANNIAKSVGAAASVDEVVRGWETARRVPLDLGVAEGVWGRRHFVEAVGGGLIPTAIAEMQSRSDGDDLPANAKVAGAVRAVGEVLSRLQPGEWTIVADGVRTIGEFLLVEVLNIRSVGPNLVLSAEASPSDGLLRLVVAGEEHRETLAQYLQELFEGRHPTPPSLTSQGGRHITLLGATDVHADDEVLSGSAGRTVSIHIEAGALELVV
jgi:diacylglycerol kinase family enzyme